MVYVNSKKFACESCIKGHRSSSCHHTDRPLFEIKKKGRPVSQCEKCRELRQSKKVHSKCTCNPKADPASRGEVLASATSKSRRFIPIVPALPNGLQDVLAASRVRSSLPANVRQRVDSLLNPCNCKSVWNCDCRQTQSLADMPAPEFTGNLTTLAHAAAMCSTDASAGSSSSSVSMSLDQTAKIALPKTVSRTPSPAASAKRHTSRPPTPQRGLHKRSKHHHDHHRDHHLRDNRSTAMELLSVRSAREPIIIVPGKASELVFDATTSLVNSRSLCGNQSVCPKCIERQGTKRDTKDLQDGADGNCGTCFENHKQNDCSRDSPSLELPPIHASTESPLQIPDFGFMPPISTITSLAGSGCTCGVRCACPGCVEHRGPGHAAKDVHDCTDGKCRTCVDNQSGIALPASTSPFSSTSAASTSSSSVDFIINSTPLNRFFARAAALPPPPGRRMHKGVGLDPCDIVFGFGNAPPVNLPKLECCSGKCGCNDYCTCSTSCGGCCADSDSPSHPTEATTGGSPVVPPRPSSGTVVVSQSALTVPAAPFGSCCG